VSRPSDYRLIIPEGWFRSTWSWAPAGSDRPARPRNRKDESSLGNRSTNVVLVLRRAGHPLTAIDYMQVFEDHKNDLRR
jgi:hypothetical protein